MRPPKDNPSEFLQKISPYVESDGARNILQISRDISIPYATLRARLQRLKEQGISILPIVDSEKIGLERIRVQFMLSKEITNHKPFFATLHQEAGLTYYARTLVSQLFDCEFMIPQGMKSKLHRLLNSLVDLKLIHSLGFHTLLWKDTLMMKTQYYDYELGNWDVDFSNIKADPSKDSGIVKSGSDESKFDHTDLQIIRWLRHDPWTKTKDLAKKMNTNEGIVAYHLARHVFGDKQIPSFRLKWTGQKEALAKHTIVGITLLFKDITKSARHAISVLTSLPFTWNHMLSGDNYYISELLIPIGYLAETMRYISDNLRPLDLKPMILYGDWNCASSFTIPYMLHVKGEGWNFEPENSLKYILRMCLASH